MIKMCVQCFVHQSEASFPEYSRRCNQCSKKPTYAELEQKLAIAKEALTDSSERLRKNMDPRCVQVALDKAIKQLSE